MFSTLETENSSSKYWFVIRNYINDILIGGSPALQKSLKSKWSLFFGRVQNVWLFRSFHNQILFIGNSTDLIKTSETYVHRLFHSLIQELHENRCHIIVKGPSPSSRFSNLTLMEIAVFILALLIHPFVNRECKALSSRLRDAQLTVSVSKIISYYYASCFLWRILFSVFRPKAIFISDISNAFNMGLIQASYQKKIKNFEVQHGLINPEHVTYFYRSPLENKNLVPNELLCYGPYFQHFFKNGNAAYNFDQTTVIGHPTLSLTSQTKITAITSHILVTLQDPLCDDLYKVTVELAKRHPTISFVCLPRNVRPMPEQPLPNLSIAEKGSFYDLVRSASLHITAYSTTAYEALYFGVPNILFNLNNSSLRYLSDLIRINEFTKVSNTVDEATAQIELLLKANPSKVAKSSDYFFANAHQERIRIFLKSQNLLG